MAAATYQDILDAPENMIAEIIDGELMLSPRRRNVRSAVLQGEFMMLTRGIMHTLPRPEIHVQGHVLVPDQAGWWSNPLAEDPDPDWQDLPLPDWILDYRDGRRREIWRCSGIPHLWFLDIEGRTLKADGQIFGFEDKIRAAPLGIKPFTLKELWS
jgi:hypothetical protein